MGSIAIVKKGLSLTAKYGGGDDVIRAISYKCRKIQKNQK